MDSLKSVSLFLNLLNYVMLPEGKDGYQKMQDWQVDAWITWMRNTKGAWRITSGIVDQNFSNNSPDHKRDVYEKLFKYNNELTPPKGRILLKFEKWDQVRKICYNWNARSKKRGGKESGPGSTGQRTLKVLKGVNKDIYDLFYGKRLPKGAASPTVSDKKNYNNG